MLCGGERVEFCGDKSEGLQRLRRLVLFKMAFHGRKAPKSCEKPVCGTLFEGDFTVFRQQEDRKFFRTPPFGRRFLGQFRLKIGFLGET